MAGREIINRQVNIYIQSGEAAKAYDKLIAKQKAFNDELKTATNPKRIQELRDGLAKLEEPISRAAKKLSGELEPSLRDTNATVTKLRNNLSHLSESDADFKKLNDQFRQGTKELEQQRQKVGLMSKAWKSFWQEARTVAAGVIIGNTIQSALQTVLGYVNGIVTGSAKIADELSDIEKTTGLTSAQVKDLNRELAKIDTRTSRSELRKLATEAGKLGFESADEILKFVDAADKIKVALKEDLGEGAILDIAKTSKIFQVEMLNMASAINQVGASSSASEAFSVDFLKRTGGVAATVKIAAGDVLGYSSAIEQAGLTAEVSTTALNTFFLDFVANSEKFGKAAGFASGELSKIINTQGTNEGFLQFLQKLKEANPSAASFIKQLNALGIDGARGSNVMLTLANNIGEVRKQQGIANDAIKSSSSVMNEFNKKNNNAAAELDKLKKNVAGLFQSESLQAAGRAAIQLLSSFINVLKSSFNFIREHGGLVATLGTLYALLVVRIKGASLAQAAHNLITKAGAILTNVIASAQAFYVAVTMRSTAQLTLARRAQMAWNAAASLGAGPLGVLIVGIGALAIGIGKLFSGTKKLTDQQRLQAEIAKKVNETTADTIAQTEALLKIANDENASLENRKKAIQELININPAFANTLKINADGHLEGVNSINQYISALKTKAEAEAKYALLVEKIKLKNEQFNIIRDAFNLPGASDSFLEQQVRVNAGKKTGIFTGPEAFVIKNQAKGLLGLLNQINILQTDIAKTSVQTTNTTVAGADLIDEKTEQIGTTADKTKNKLDDLLKELAKIRQELRFAQLAPLDRELAEMDVKFNSLRDRAGKNMKLLQVIDQLHQESRLFLIREYARKEVEEWSKAQAEVNDKADKAFKKSLKLLKNAGSLLSTGNDGKIRAITQALENDQDEEEEQDRQAKLRKINTYINYVQQLAGIASIFDNAQTNRENAQLEADRRRNDIKKSNLEKRLKSGMLTQLQYDREVQKMEREQQKRERDVAIKQFKRQQRADIIQAIINGALAVTSTLAAKPGATDIATFGVLRAIQIGLAVATTAAQVATIAGQKPPQYFARGGKLKGRYHSAGGNPILDGSGNLIGEIERDEGILNRFSMRDRRNYSVTGTPSQIASKLNALHGGVHWDPGARLVPKWAQAKPLPFNFPGINKYYAAGGRFNTAVQGGNIQQFDNLAIDRISASLDQLNSILANGIYAYTLITQQEKEQQRLNNIRDDATMR